MPVPAPTSATRAPHEGPSGGVLDGVQEGGRVGRAVRGVLGGRGIERVGARDGGHADILSCAGDSRQYVMRGSGGCSAAGAGGWIGRWRLLGRGRVDRAVAGGSGGDGSGEPVPVGQWASGPACA